MVVLRSVRLKLVLPQQICLGSTSGNIIIDSDGGTQLYKIMLLLVVTLVQVVQQMVTSESVLQMIMKLIHQSVI